jgi:hypothetical protein
MWIVRAAIAAALAIWRRWRALAAVTGVTLALILTRPGRSRLLALAGSCPAPNSSGPSPWWTK